MSKWTKEELEEMFFDVVNILHDEMSEDMVFDYGQNGYKLTELVQKVVDDKNRQIELLSKDFTPIVLTHPIESV